MDSSMSRMNRAEQVMMLLNGGLAPSEIDRRLGFVDGTARTVITAMWAHDKEMARYERADYGWSK